MEFFNKAKAVRLKSHLDKYLVADDDEQTVRQSRNGGASKKARWTVELVEGNPHVIRLKGCHGKYLTATTKSFLLGVTGKKVLQTVPATMKDNTVEWEPIKEGYKVKLRTKGGKFLRANGATPPWRNSITHDLPHRTATQDWVLWEVEMVDISVLDNEYISSYASSFSSEYEYSDSNTRSPSITYENREKSLQSTATPESRRPSISASQSRWPSIASDRSSQTSGRQVSGMELFKKAKSVQLKSHHEKYLTAGDDEESTIQDRAGSSKNAKWTVEFVEGVDNIIRLKSCYGKYLSASDEQFLLGVTGNKVVQTFPRKLDSSVEWEPIRDGMKIKLKTRYGNYLRANGGLPPWRNSVTHDIPHRHHDWILWDVDVVEILQESRPKVSQSESLEDDVNSSSFRLMSPAFPNIQPGGLSDDSPRKSEGRLIYYNVADDYGNVNDSIQGPSFQFKGHGVEELTEKLAEETGLQNIIVCSRNRVNGKLYPLRLSLPPNNTTMHVVVVPSASRVASDFISETPSSA